MAPLQTYTQGTYPTDDGLRELVIVQYGSWDFAVVDELVHPRGEDRDERFVESGLPTFDEARAVAVDYLGNARVERKPLARAL
jgi:hypothetical protein